MDKLKIGIPSLLMATESIDLNAAQLMGIPLFTAYSSQFKNYIEVKSLECIDTVTYDTTFTWLDNAIGGGATIRSFIINEITY